MIGDMTAQQASNHSYGDVFGYRALNHSYGNIFSSSYS